MSLSRKRKKELRKLQKHANDIWESQQVLVGEAADIAREAGRQLGNYGREQVVPQVQEAYGKYAQPYVQRGLASSKSFLTRGSPPPMASWNTPHSANASIGPGPGNCDTCFF